MAKGLYESLNSGLDNLIKTTVTESVLNEKKQKISPEDERDNELIRSAIRKRNNRANAKLSKEEKDALERNGYEVSDKVFRTANGYINADSMYRIKPEIKTAQASSNNNTRIFDDRDYDYKTGRYIVKPANVNLADMGRKQRERAENGNYGKYLTRGGWGDYSYTYETDNTLGRAGRGEKKNKTQMYYRREPEFTNTKDYPSGQNPGNRLVQERQAAQKLIKGKDAITKYKADKEKLSAMRKTTDYDRYEQERQKYIKEIERLKKLLSGIDARIEDDENRVSSDIKRVKDSMKDTLEKRRAEFNARHQKSEAMKRVQRRRMVESKRNNKRSK
jgi:hypothetical protein